MAQIKSESLQKPQQQLPPTPSKDPDHKFLRRGDLVRVSACGIAKEKRLKDKEGNLGRIIKCESIDGTGTPCSFRYDVEWVLGGRLPNCEREDLVYRTADDEGMTDSSDTRRRKRKPVDFMEDAARMDEAKRKRREEQKEKQLKKKAKLSASTATKTTKATKSQPAKKVVAKTAKKAMTAKKPAKKKVVAKSNSSSGKTPASSLKGRNSNETKKPANANGSKRKREQALEPEAEEQSNSTAMDLYERQRREFVRIVTRMKEKVDLFRHFWPENAIPPPEFDEKYDNEDSELSSNNNDISMNENQLEESSPDSPDAVTDMQEVEQEATKSLKKDATCSGNGKIGSLKDAKNKMQSSIFPSHPPYNWEMIERRMEKGRYVLDRQKGEEEERFKLFGPYYESLGKNRPRRKFIRNQQEKCEINANEKKEETKENPRVACPFGVDWDVFRDDIIGMCDAGLARSDPSEDDGQKGSISYTVRKVKETVEQAYERTGTRHVAEMTAADDRHKFFHAIEKYENKEAAMQSWRQLPFPERKYERISVDAVCDGLSKVDERIARYELKTNLPDSFIGLSYLYNDTSQSEAWMKSVVDETGDMSAMDEGESSNKQKVALQALAADDGVTRAQVNATMQSLLIKVQDKVMTENKVLEERELRSANWLAEHETERSKLTIENGANCASKDLETSKLTPEIVEQPVWGLDCYTRRNISVCLEVEFDAQTALTFIEKWLLPAINACPEHLAQNIGNAARILEGLPFDYRKTTDTNQENEALIETPTMEEWSQNLLAQAIQQKMRTSAPPWLKAAANQLRRAREALGPNFFRVHPKGHGSVLLSPRVKANKMVTFYHGELYPSWRWGEKLDAVEITQQRKNLKPTLPDFYNMVLERPQMDPRGYGLLFVDASRKAGHGSSLSHSCDPTCEVRVAAVNGELCLAMTTLRELEMGEELTFDYNAVTESLTEYRSAVCLCGYGKCRGSFLHFATADCYQSILNRNSPVASRFASLVKGSMKQVMSEDDDKVLRNHGFLTASFGAISVNRREVSKDGQSTLIDSLDMVPVWLRTYIADTLRYIEYERRALPIALICESIKSKEKDPSDETMSPSKEPKPEPSFFYFSRTQKDFLSKLLEDEGLPSSLKGIQRKQAQQRVASAYWHGLPEEEKKQWKEKARADYEKKLKAWQTEQKKGKQGLGKDKKKGKKNSKSEISDILLASTISFQDADAESISAMEQRIQQLTQTLSRIGRVLDRHREESFRTDQSNPNETDDVYGSMRKRVHEPITVLSDDMIVGWMWNNTQGIVPTLIRSIEASRCARPTLLEKILLVKKKYCILEKCSDPAKQNGHDDPEPADTVINSRSQLNKALLEMREVILNELNDMASEFKNYRAKKGMCSQSPSAVEEKGANAEESETSNGGIVFDNAARNESNTITAIKMEGHAGVIEGSTDVSIEGSVLKDSLSLSHRVTSNSHGDMVSNCEVTSVYQSLGESANVKLENDQDENFQTENRSVDKLSDADVFTVDRLECEIASTDDRSVSTDFSGIKHEALLSEFGHWVAFYNERFTLEAAADLLLLHAHTSNFFLMKPYKELESSPVEVYARELGNAVPKTVIDTELDKIATSKESIIESTESKLSRVEELSQQETLSSCHEQSSVRSRPKKDLRLCEPDEIVAKVTVKYQGDYVLSQLLQWYNAGIGQKPGLPDLLGCILLPSMSGCWSSELLATSRLKAEKKTTYNSKIRPRLVEWFQDQHERGNPWPKEIRKAFEAKDAILPKDTSDLFLPLGSPVLDFLVTGDESNISLVLNELDAEDKIAAKTSSGGLLSSVDKGRPAQAVSTWVQCEMPNCMKWRKIPWYVDADMLPEKFYCKDNKWNPAANNCDAPEDDWDESDAIVGADGKVEGSPIKKANTASTLSILDEKSFTIGARFDVRREGKNSKFAVGTVTKVDFSGFKKRIMFHFIKTSSDRDEWIEFGSDRIAPLYSKVPKQLNTKRRDSTGNESKAATEEQGDSEVNTEGLLPTLDERNFTVGARFDVCRQEKNAKFTTGTVTHVDFAGPKKRIRFHFNKTSTCRDEWIELGSDRIAPLFSKSRKKCENFQKPKTKKLAKCQKSSKNSKKRLDEIESVSNVPGKRTGSDAMIDAGNLQSEISIASSHSTANTELESGIEGKFSIDCSLIDEAKETPDESNCEEDIVNLETTESIDESNRGNTEFRDSCSRGKLKTLDESDRGKTKVKKKSDLGNTPLDPSDEKNFVVGARFDIFRTAKSKYQTGVVKEVDFSPDAKRILFHFPKTNVKFDEWIEFGSSRIHVLNSKVPAQMAEIAEKKQAKANSKLELLKNEKVNSVDPIALDREGESRENDNSDTNAPLPIATNAPLPIATNAPLPTAGDFRAENAGEKQNVLSGNSLDFGKIPRRKVDTTTLNHSPVKRSKPNVVASERFDHNFVVNAKETSSFEKHNIAKSERFDQNIVVKANETSSFEGHNLTKSQVQRESYHWREDDRNHIAEYHASSHNYQVYRGPSASATQRGSFQDVPPRQTSTYASLADPQPKVHSSAAESGVDRLLLLAAASSNHVDDGAQKQSSAVNNQRANSYYRAAHYSPSNSEQFNPSNFDGRYSQTPYGQFHYNRPRDRPVYHNRPNVEHYYTEHAFYNRDQHGANHPPSRHFMR